MILNPFMIVLENLTRIMATEGTLFIFEWHYLMWCSIHPISVRRKLINNDDVKYSTNGTVHMYVLIMIIRI